MPSLTALYVDFTCPHSYRAWRWLSLLPEHEHIEVRPYSLDTDDGERRNPWDRSTPTTGLELLALGELARETGDEAMLRYIDAAFAAVHDGSADLSRPEGWLALGADVGLDLDRFIADADRWRAEVGLWHQEAEDDLGVTGTPNLVFDDEHALWVKLDADVTSKAAARELLDDLAALAVQPVEEVRRSV